MNKSIILMTVKQLWNRPVRLLILVGFTCFPLLVDVMARQMGHSKAMSGAAVVSNVPAYVMIIGAGIIGQDISDGILPLIFSRPIKRWWYVVSKWLTLAGLATVVTVLNFICHLLLVHGFTGELINQISALEMLEILLAAIGTSSVLLLLSSLLPGAADLGLMLLVTVATFVMMMLQELLKVPGMQDTAQNVLALLYPSLDISGMKSLRELLSIDVGRYFAIVCVCLTASILLVNKKELSYGSN
jgi:ABC-type transport system involved in multi-copper enzyme maturation permease subunit